MLDKAVTTFTIAVEKTSRVLAVNRSAKNVEQHGEHRQTNALSDRMI